MGTSKQQDASGALSARQKVEKLLKAARDGDLAGFKVAATLIADGEELSEAVGDVKDGNGRGALHFAARGGHENICQYLVEELHLPVDPLDDEGETPLIFAARAGLYTTAKYLLDHGANAHASAQELGTSALHHAAGTGSLELMKLLLEKGVAVDAASSSGTPLIWAAGHGRLEAVKLLLERHADANSSTEDGATPLLTAVAAQQPEIVELLIKNGAEANIVAGGVTPLHIAAEQGNKQTIKHLLAAGANPNVTDEAEMTPIQVAAISGHRPIVKILLPVTAVLQAVEDWSVDGLFEHAKQLAAEVEVPPEKKEKALEAKARGTEFFQTQNYTAAIDAYTQALDLDPSNFQVLSNRSLCWLKIGQAEQALTDAQACRKLAPNWVKAYYREGAALRQLQRFDEAADAFYCGVKVNPDSKDVIEAFQEAVAAGKKFHGVK
ncbi:hypothetical protein AXG93_2931s1410 [Marchantia polymorpha subsp. ruderalis]|uniref:Serine/threonine-protein kinase BSK1-like TPR repeats domain-containing protein n=1 Tax=Marchantia polymorpha subsp. ruderalis TaxID=1480154 RepID=A0A176VVR3_MARPO|nr:hypothetical protein AXG93_2931s1410 [Marchantia polymorpha subsp. ruderalis]